MGEGIATIKIIAAGT